MQGWINSTGAFAIGKQREELKQVWEKRRRQVNQLAQQKEVA
jgi:hypothetical protein